MILSDRDIRALCVGVARPMIAPFRETESAAGGVSYGLTHSGYDVRLGGEVMLPWPRVSNFQPAVGVADFAASGVDRYFQPRIALADGECLVLSPGQFALVRTAESFAMPRGVSATCWGKSTLARLGLWVNNTVIEPGWEGVLTLELCNLFPLPLRLVVGEGVAQVRFERLSSEPEVSYADKGGVYQGQAGVTPARVRG